ncbi:MAG: hypothetical protein HUU29_13300 [Planctomycetaceae bacterium]|nr:hypothetical protein [Planctomycetaceae bacterium]
MTSKAIFNFSISIASLVFLASPLCAVDITSPGNGGFGIIAVGGLGAIEGGEYVMRAKLGSATMVAVNDVYYVKLEATGGMEPYAWEVDGLPEGMKLSTGAEVLARYATLTTTEMQPGDIIIDGTPAPGAAAGGYEGKYGLNFTVTDANGDVDHMAATLEVAPPIVFQTTTLPRATLKQPYGYPKGYVTVEFSGGTLPGAASNEKAPYGWDILHSNIASTIPGLDVNLYTFQVGYFKNGNPKYQHDYAIEGTPLVSPGTYTVTLAVTPKHLWVANYFASGEVELEVIAPIETTVLPDATAGIQYGPEALPISEYQPYAVLDITGLPSGLKTVTLPTGEAAISGKPLVSSAANDPYKLHVIVDANSGGKFPVVFEFDLELTVLPDELAILTAKLPAASTGQSYTASLVASGGVLPVLWTVTGLPPGLTLEQNISSSIATLSGVPEASAEAAYTITASVTDSAENPETAVFKYFLSVSASPSPIFSMTTTYLPSATENEPYGPITLGAANGTAPYSWNAVGLPDGLTLGVDELEQPAIEGSVPSGSAGTFYVQLSVADAQGQTDSAIFPLVVKASGQEPNTFTTTGDVPPTDMTASVLGGAAAAGACAITSSSNTGIILPVVFVLAIALAFRRVTRG